MNNLVLKVVDKYIYDLNTALEKEMNTLGIDKNNVDDWVLEMNESPISSRNIKWWVIFTKDARFKFRKKTNLEKANTKKEGIFSKLTNIFKWAK